MQSPGFPLLTPVPPHALLGWKPWIAGLSDSSREDVKAAGILPLSAQLAKPLVEHSGVVARKLSDAPHAK
jgi:hypothetical protein